MMNALEGDEPTQESATRRVTRSDTTKTGGDTAHQEKDSYWKPEDTLETIRARNAAQIPTKSDGTAYTEPPPPETKERVDDSRGIE